MTMNIAKPPISTGPVNDAIDSATGPVLARPRDCPADHVIDWHTHTRAQLLFAETGVMRVTTDGGVWVVPPQRAVWIPPGVRHHVAAQGTPLSLRSLYVRNDLTHDLPSDCCVITVSPLLRELIIASMTIPDEPGPDSPERRLLGVLIDQIRAVTVTPLHLPGVADRRLKRITEAIEADPADDRTLADWAGVVGASERTLSRKFVSETGLTFGHWRQQARLLAALTRLARGESVTEVSMDLGYASQSAFIAMFRRALGKTPGRYFSTN